MRRQRLWRRLFLAYLWVPAVLLLSAGLYASHVVRELYLDHLTADLEALRPALRQADRRSPGAGPDRPDRPALQGTGRGDQYADHGGAPFRPGDRRFRREPAATWTITGRPARNSSRAGRRHRRVDPRTARRSRRSASTWRSRSGRPGRRRPWCGPPCRVTRLDADCGHRPRPVSRCGAGGHPLLRGGEPGDFPPHEPPAGTDQGRGRAVRRRGPRPSAAGRRPRGGRRRGRRPEPHGGPIGRTDSDRAPPTERARSDALQHGGRSLGHRQQRHDPEPEQDLRRLCWGASRSGSKAAACTR